MRRLALVSLFVVLVATPALPARITFAAETEAERAARAIADARDEVAAAAEAYMAASEEIDQLTDEQQELQVEVDALQTQVDALRQQVQQVAINRYTRSPAEGSPILDGFGTPMEQMQIDALSEVIWDASDTSFDELDSINRQLTRQQTSLQRSQQRSEQRMSDMAALQQKAEDKVERLKQVEKQRLKDAATQQALDLEQARRAVKSTGVAQNTARTVSSNASGGSSLRSVVVSTGRGGGMVNLGAGEASQGVRFGKGIGYPFAPFGSGGRPTTIGVDYSRSRWVCPTGPANVGFGNGFIVPGTPGRQHNGIDVFGKAGTPLVAVVDGNAKAVLQEQGGMNVFLYGNDGDFYFYAHLEAWGQMGPVKKGTIIGYMGTTGHSGGNHLHFEWHPGGVGNPQNPFSKLSNYC